MPARRHTALLFTAALVRTGTSQQTILDEMRRVILDGAVPPGTPISVNDVAEVFGVSSIPVRESLKTLTGEGLVAHQPNVGYAVAQLTAAELAEMYLVRETLETAALAAAVQNAPPADHAHLDEVNRLLERAVREDDPHTYHRQSRQFHLGLARPSRMQRLLRMLESAWNITEPVQLMVRVDHSHRALLHDDHQRMLAAFRSGDVTGLLATAAEHNRRLNDVVTLLPADGGRIYSSRNGAEISRG